jgi:hypothetical protein
MIFWLRMEGAPRSDTHNRLWKWLVRMNLEKSVTDSRSDSENIPAWILCTVLEGDKSESLQNICLQVKIKSLLIYSPNHPWVDSLLLLVSSGLVYILHKLKNSLMQEGLTEASVAFSGLDWICKGKKVTRYQWYLWQTRQCLLSFALW